MRWLTVPETPDAASRLGLRAPCYCHVTAGFGTVQQALSDDAIEAKSADAASHCDISFRTFSSEAWIFSRYAKKE
jgi:hypothetical protein